MGTASEFCCTAMSLNATTTGDDDGRGGIAELHWLSEFTIFYIVLTGLTCQCQLLFVLVHLMYGRAGVTMLKLKFYVCSSVVDCPSGKWNSSYFQLNITVHKLTHLCSFCLFH